jgi:glycosyltransferase involved in cell wall biosynthesis
LESRIQEIRQEEILMPLISVIMPIFNGESYILESVRSILSQTTNDIELIIIDDGSTDGSEKIIQSIGDSRIIYQKLKKNTGIAAAMNFGYDLAKGKYIAHMDQDDIALPSRLKQQASFLEESPHVDIMGGWMEAFNSITRIGVSSTSISDGKIKANLLFGTKNIYNPTAMLRHSFVKEKKLKFNPIFKSPDWPFWVEAMFRGACFANLSKVVLRYRVHGKQESKDMSRFWNEFMPIRLSILELFYPELTPEEKITVEPLLRFLPSPVSLKQTEAGLGIIDKLLQYKTQSRVKEDRQTLEDFLEARKNAVRKALEQHRQPA